MLATPIRLKEKEDEAFSHLNSTTLDRLLSPLSREIFFRDYWTKKFLHLPAQAGKFDALFSWDVLNRALEEHRFDSKRLRLVKAGTYLDPGRYLRDGYVHAANVVNALTNGSTLIFNGCEEVHPPLRELCLELERLFHHRVNVNLYAGWRRDNGFNVHWDPQDTIILQVSGRKKWKVWAPERLYPFEKDVVDTSALTAPAEDPLWDDVLCPGALLSIPRGWWHVACPMDEPCLHLTVTIRNLNGIDLLHWFANRMMTSETARREVPVVASAEERKSWLAQVFRDMTDTWSSEILDEFLSDVDSRATARPRFALPAEPALRHQAGISRDTGLELAIARPLSFKIENGTALCRGNGSAWKMNPEMARKLGIFNDFAPHTLAEIGAESDLRINAVVAMMLMNGVLRRSGI